MVGRTSFKGDILYSACVSGLIYPIFGHWVWGPGGWLSTTLGWFDGIAEDGLWFRDFAGSTVVHIGLFASGDFGLPGPLGADDAAAKVEGLFYGGGTDQLVIQAIGSISCIVAVSVVSMVIFKIIRSLPGSWNLRLEEELELEGIDISEHGNTAYHMEFGQGMTYVTSTGLPPRPFSPPSVGTSSSSGPAS